MPEWLQLLMAFGAVVIFIVWQAGAEDAERSRLLTPAAKALGLESQGTIDGVVDGFAVTVDIVSSRSSKYALFVVDGQGKWDWRLNDDRMVPDGDGLKMVDLFDTETKRLYGQLWKGAKLSWGKIEARTQVFDDPQQYVDLVKLMTALAARLSGASGAENLADVLRAADPRARFYAATKLRDARGLEE
jgi:hypothetical protein